MMLSSLQLQFDSDAETNEMLSSSAITARSCATITDTKLELLLLENEIAHESEHPRALAIMQPTDSLRVVTISYEEALQRELDFQKRMKRTLLQPTFGCGSFPAPSKELPAEPALTGMKRKLVPGSLPEPVLMQQLQHQKPVLQQPQASTRGRSYRQPLPQHSLDQQPPPLARQLPMQHLQHPKLTLQCPKLAEEGQRYRQPLPQNSLGRHPQLHQSQHQVHHFWCNLCKVDCGNPFNLKKHRLGRKHRTHQELVYGGKKNTMLNENEMVWCKECSVPCMNAGALAQHYAGKKHALRLLALQSENGFLGTQ